MSTATLARSRPASGSMPDNSNYKWIAAAVVMVGAIMSILDQTVVNIALPSLERDFHTSLTDIQWVVTGYALGLAAVIPTSGWLADRFGTKRVFLISQIGFTAASAICGLSFSSGMLIGVRVLQGLAGGLIMPTAMTIMMAASRPEERGRMGAVLGVPMMIAPILGPTLGGWLIQAVSWRLIFYINVPIGVIGAILSLLVLRPGETGREREPLDWRGLLLASPGVVGIVYGLSQPATYGWDSLQTLGPLLAGTAVVVGFCLYELRQRFPLIEIRVFRDAAFSAAMGMSVLIAIALFGAVLLMPLFLQQIQGYGALASGLILTAQGIGAMITMPLAGWLTDRIGAPRIVPVGLALLAASTWWMTTIQADTSRATIMLMLGVRGLGMGLTMMPAMASAYVTMAPGLVARATAASNVIQRVASALGVAIMTTILSSRISANLPAVPRGVPVNAGGNLAGVHLPQAIKSFVLAQATKGFDDTFWVATGLAVLAFPMALLLRRAWRPDEVRAYGLRQLAEGMVLSVAARRLADGQDGDRLGADGPYRTLAEAASTRLRTGSMILQAGTAVAGLVPQPPLSTWYRALIVVVTVASLALAVFLVAHGFQQPHVPPLPLVRPSP